MAIDMHVHWIPPGFADALRARTERPAIAPRDGGLEALLSYRGLFPLDEGFTRLDRQIALMESHGVEMTLLSLPGLFGVDNKPLDVSGPLTRIFNDEIAAACAAHPDRFVALAALPWADMDAAVAEFERAMRLPGVIGAILPANGFSTAARAQAFRPILAAANRHGAHIMVHPGPLPGEEYEPPPADEDNFRHRRNTLGNQWETSQVMVTLCLTDILDVYPEITVQVPDLGGNLALEIERMDYNSSYRAAEPVLPSQRLGRVYVDTNSFGPRAVALATEVFGPDRVVIGTDGTDFGMEWCLGGVRRAKVAEDARQRVLSGNARALIDRALANKADRRAA